MTETVGVADVVVGVDVGKGKHFAWAVDAGGETLFRGPVQNGEAAVRGLLEKMSVRGRVAVVVDMTSSPAMLVLAVAAEVGVPVAYVSGLVMRRAADLYAGAAKTDRKDAWVLADYARRYADRLNWVTVGDDLMARLRVLNGRDTDLAADVTRAANRLRDALLAVCPALERAVGDRLVRVGGLRAALQKWSTPTALREAGDSRIQETIAQRSPRAAAGLAAAIGEALASQTVTVAAEAAWGEAIGALARDLDRLITERDQLTTQIEEVFNQHPQGKVLGTMCGFGPRTGSRTLAEIGDPHRFASPARLAAYAGLAPTDWQSGRTNTTRKPRGGNRRLKDALFTAAFVATRHDPHARAYYQRKRNEGKSHNAAVISVARRRCDIILAMLKNQTPYQPPTTQPA